MKKLPLTLLSLITVFGLYGIAFGAPTATILRDIFPETTNTYSLGTSTKVWNSASIKDITISGTCTGCGGGGSITSSSPITSGNFPYWTSPTSTGGLNGTSTLALSGSTLTQTGLFRASAGVAPTTNDGAALGSSTAAWSDLFLGSGGVINWGGGALTLTQDSADHLQMTGSLGVDAGGINIAGPSEGANNVTSIIMGSDVSFPRLFTITAGDVSRNFTMLGNFTVNGTTTISGNGTSTLANVSSTNLQASGSLTVAGTSTLSAVDYNGLPSTNLQAVGPQTRTFSSGTSTTGGELVYMNATARWDRANASASTTSQGLLGISLVTAASGTAMNVALPGSFVRNSSWTFTTGQTLYASTTVGNISGFQPTSTNNVVRVLGWAVSTTIMYFNPSPDFLTII